MIFIIKIDVCKWVGLSRLREACNNFDEVMLRFSVTCSKLQKYPFSIYHWGVRAYSRHLLGAVLARNDFLNNFGHFLTPKTLNLHAVKGGLHVWIALNLLKSVLFLNTAHMPCLSKICPGVFLTKLDPKPCNICF